MKNILAITHFVQYTFCKFALCLVVILPFTLLNCQEDSRPKIVITTLDFSACAGAEVQILGSGFSTVAGENVVRFGDVPAEIVLNSRTALHVIVPANAEGEVSVEVRGRRTKKGPVFTPSQADHYIKFKANGVAKIFEICHPVYVGGIECVYGYAKETDERFSFIRICNGLQRTTPEILNSWNGDKLLFAGSTPIVTFGYMEDGAEYHSEWAAKTGQEDNESELNITSITQSPNNDGLQTYVITGTFTCFASYAALGSDVAITEGEFSMVFSLITE